MRRPLYLEERVAIADRMLNESPRLLNRLGGLYPAAAARHAVDSFIRRVMLVLNGQRTAVPRSMRKGLRR